MKVTIVIVHFGEIDTTKKCVESLYQKETTPFSLIIVNNMLDSLSAKDFGNKQMSVINNKKNLGFAKGVNIGIKKALQAKAEYICFLNNDTILQSPILKKLLNAYTSSTIGIVGPAIEFYKDKQKLYDLGGKVNKLLLRTSHEEVKKIVNKSPQKVDYVSGCCMLIKRDVFKQIGYFDESFFLYFEDVDFCLRAKQKGFATYLIPEIVIFHELSKSAGNMSQSTIFYLLQSGIRFGEKYAKNPAQIVANRLFILFQALLFLKANPKVALSITKAFLES